MHLQIPSSSKSSKKVSWDSRRGLKGGHVYRQSLPNQGVNTVAEMIYIPWVFSDTQIGCSSLSGYRFSSLPHLGPWSPMSGSVWHSNKCPVNPPHEDFGGAWWEGYLASRSLPCVGGSSSPPTLCVSFVEGKAEYACPRGQIHDPCSNGCKLHLVLPMVIKWYKDEGRV